MLSNMITCAGHNRTNQLLQDHLFQDSTVHISDRQTFLYNAAVSNDGVRSWIILGSAWGICVHRGPMGIDTLVDMSIHNFYVFPEWSVQTEHRTAPSEQNLHDDFFVWAPVPNGGYRLITRANNHKWVEGKWTESTTI